jgi:hypothetical protein
VGKKDVFGASFRQELSEKSSKNLLDGENSSGEINKLTIPSLETGEMLSKQSNQELFIR